MSKSPPIKPLGAILRQAGLVSSARIETALQEQTQYQDMKIGEILALRGWIKQETADFFVQKWPTLVTQQRKQRKQPLGYYLKEAALLDEDQISTLISEQQQKSPWIRFGALAVFKGWLKLTTVDFFLEYLFPEFASDSAFISPQARGYSDSEDQS